MTTEVKVVDQVGDLLFHLFEEAGMDYPAQTATACLSVIADHLADYSDERAQGLGVAIRTQLIEESGMTLDEIPDELEF